MSEPRLPHDLRIGRFLFDDILRAFRFCQWFLSNLTHRSQLSAPLLAEIMSCLHAAGFAKLNDLRGGDTQVYYDTPETFTRQHLVPPLDQAAVASLLAKIFAQAANLNLEATAHSPVIRKIWLFGSCLRGASAPRDIDLAVEIRRAGKLIPFVARLPFGPATEFDDAARPLALRKPRLISLHHIEEVRSIGAPHRLVWTATAGPVENAPIVSFPATAPTAGEYPDNLRRLTERQQRFDTLVLRVRSLPRWPEPPVLQIAPDRRINRSALLALQNDPLVPALAHLRCLPEGALRTRLAEQLSRARQNGKRPDSRWRRAETRIDAYIDASIRHNPWSIGPNGRIRKKSTH